MTKYILNDITMTEPAKESFNEFLALIKHGAKFIDIHVRKDAKEYGFQADFLKYITKEDGRIKKEPKNTKIDLVFMKKDGVITFHITPHGFFKRDKEYECSGKIECLNTKFIGQLRAQIEQALTLKPEDACKLEGHEE